VYEVSRFEKVMPRQRMAEDQEIEPTPLSHSLQIAEAGHVNRQKTSFQDPLPGLKQHQVVAEAENTILKNHTLVS
jgi:hypothetical protein